MNRFLYISRNYKHPDCGGGVARTDIEIVMERMGYRNIGWKRTFCHNGIVHALRNTSGVFHAIRQIRKGDIIVLQYQMKQYARVCRVARRRGAKIICLIHDLDSFRDKTLTPEQEIPLLNMADVLLTHNHNMRRWLSDHGCTVPMIDYEIMDYLKADSSEPHPYPADGNFSLFFVGNLSSEINDWIYRLAEIMPGRDIYLYGAGQDESKATTLPNLHLMGTVPDGEIISSHKGDFGVSWYGQSLDQGIGMVGEYMAYNNPHKVGLYLRCNAPVVAWSHAGRAEFISRERIGITVSSLRDLDGRLAKVTPEEYNMLIGNVERVNSRLKNGYYLQQALARAISIINNEPQNN